MLLRHFRLRPLHGAILWLPVNRSKTKSISSHRKIREIGLIFSSDFYVIFASSCRVAFQLSLPLHLLRSQLSRIHSTSLEKFVEEMFAVRVIQRRFEAINLHSRNLTSLVNWKWYAIFCRVSSTLKPSKCQAQMLGYGQRAYKIEKRILWPTYLTPT